MSLLDVRLQFVKQTGRYDLVLSQDAVTDNGANFYIKAGQRMLDRMLEFPKDQSEITVSLATSAIATTITGARAVQAVAVVDSQEETVRYLDKVSLRDIRKSYGDEVGDLTNVQPGEPNVWSLGFLRRADTPSAVTEATGFKIVTMPPADRTYELIIQVLDSSLELSGNTSINFWTEGHPEVLVWAAMYQLEVSYRNKEGAQALKANIDNAVLDISNDVIEQMQVDEGQLEDSFRFIQQPERGYNRHIG